MRSAFGKAKAVAQPHEYAGVAGCSRITIVSANFGAFAEHITVRPIAHDGHGRFAFEHHVCRSRPADRCAIFIGIRQHLGKRADALVKARVAPQGCIAPHQLYIVVLAIGGQQHAFKQVRCFKLVRATHGQRNNSRGFELGSCCKKLVHRGRRSDAVVGQHLHVEPQHIGAVNVHRHRVDFAFVGDLVQQQLRHIFVEALLFEESSQWLHLAGIHILGQLFARVYLPRVRWLAALQARLQYGFGVGASATSHGGIHNLNSRILLAENLEHRVQTVGFAAVRPPAEDFHLPRFGGGCLCSRRWRLRCRGGTCAQ